MAHALAMRATSLVASASILGLAILAALSATYVVQQLTLPDGAVITSVEPEPPPPPIEPQPNTPHTPLQPLDIALPALPTLADPTAAPTPTSIPVSASGPVTIENPHWMARPSNLARYYPRRALERGVEGAALLDCRVATSGLLSCTVLSETPHGWGFGDAALRMAGDHRMQPAMRDGVPVEGRYRMRVPFALNN